jgi:hypothetical protein
VCVCLSLSLPRITTPGTRIWAGVKIPLHRSAFRPSLEPIKLLIQFVRGLSQGLKRPVCEAGRSPSDAEVRMHGAKRSVVTPPY